MGSHMSTNLLKKGYNLVVFDIYPESIESLKVLGATVATSPYDVAQRVKKVITMLPSRYVTELKPMLTQIFTLLDFFIYQLTFN